MRDLTSLGHRFPLLRCLALYRYMPWRFSLTTLLYLVVNLSLSWQQWLIGRAVNDVAKHHAVVKLPNGQLDYHVAVFWLVALLAISFSRGVLQYLAGIMSLIIGQDLLFILRERILSQVQRLDLAYHWRHGVGEIVTRTTRDADKLRDALVNFWKQAFETTLVILAGVGIMCWYSPWLGIVPLVLTLAGMAILIQQTNYLVTLDRAVGSAYDQVNQNLNEGVSGVRVIKAFGLEAARIDSFTVHVELFTQHARTALAYAASRIPVPQIVIALGHVWVLGFGAWLVSQGHLNLGELVASMLIANTLILRIETIGKVIQVFADARASATRLWDVLDAEPKITGGSTPIPDTPLGVSFNQVQVFGYDGGKAVLRECTFKIQPGEIVALVGQTGSGKSTLMGLLPRLIDADAGVVAIGSDELGWQDIKHADLGAIRKRIHVVPQESFLFSDTLASNLRQAAPDATDDDLYEALRLASALEVLDRLEHGLETRLGDRGVNLSGGQRQRICLARALLSHASILGFDDATSALDAATEQTILHNIRSYHQTDGKSTTVLIVSSKLSTVLMADRVIVLADGHIHAQGTHDELVHTSRAYRELMGI